jgi:hypothetical protein
MSEPIIQFERQSKVWVAQIRHGRLSYTAAGLTLINAANALMARLKYPSPMYEAMRVAIEDLNDTDGLRHDAASLRHLRDRRYR